MVDPTKFIGRKATICKKCGGGRHFVNKLGGIQCSLCSPAKAESDVLLQLRIDGGRWNDAHAFLDLPPLPAATPTAAKENHSNPVSKAAQESFGCLSDREVDIFTSELVWSTDDQWIVYRSNPRSVIEPYSKRQRIPAGNSSVPLPTAGIVVKVRNSLKSFMGSILPNSRLIVSQAYHDEFGDACVNLSRNGQEVLCGIAWPIEGAEIDINPGTRRREALSLDLL